MDEIERKVLGERGLLKRRERSGRQKKREEGG